jgi:hypothetical protein
LVYANDVTVMGRSIHTIKENKDALIVASKETRLEVSVGKAKCMVKSQDQNARRSQSIRTDNSSFESVEDFKYLEITFTNQNHLQ